jgi:hypothetical protein
MPNDQVKYNKSIRGLSDTIDPTYTLLYNHWVPRQIVVHQNGCALEVDTFTTNVRRKEYGDVCAFQKVIDCHLTCIDIDATMNHSIRHTTLAQHSCEVIESASKEGKYDHLSRRLFRVPILAPNRI